MSSTLPIARSRRWAIAMGIGLALIPIHNWWLTEITSINGQATLFLPAFGMVIWILVTLFYMRDNWGHLGWGDRRILIPLIIIAASIGISGIYIDGSLQDKITPLFMGVFLLSTYVVCRNLGVTVFRTLIPFVIVGVIIETMGGILHPGNVTDGMITNYCAAAGFLVFGAILNPGKGQWLLIAFTCVGVFFVGAAEAVFIVAVVAVVVIARRDVGKRLLAPVATVAILFLAATAVGLLVPLYQGNGNFATLFSIIIHQEQVTFDSVQLLTSGRWSVILDSLRHITFLGHGFSTSTVSGGIIHNIPLIIMYQVGPLASVAWVFVTVFCLVKTKWKYAWVAIIAASVFDHYLWTQFSPWWWALAGVSTASNIKTDFIFRRV